MRALKPKHLMSNLQRRFISSPTYQSEWDDYSVPHWFYQELSELHRLKRERQANLIGGLPTSCAQALHIHGIWMKHNILPKEFFRRMKYEAFDYFVGQRDRSKRLLSSWHKSLSFTLPLHYTSLLRQPFLQSAITDSFISKPLQYTAGRKAKPEFQLEAMAQCAPSFTLGDYEHSSAPFAIEHYAAAPGATALLFLESITPEDGALFYIPGSHKMTEERIYWEYQRQLEEENLEDDEELLPTSLNDLRELDLPPLLPLRVEANTLLIWDQTGFHGRLPSINNSKDAHAAPKLALRANIATKANTRRV